MEALAKALRDPVENIRMMANNILRTYYYRSEPRSKYINSYENAEMICQIITNLNNYQDTKNIRLALRNILDYIYDEQLTIIQNNLHLAIKFGLEPALVQFEHRFDTLETKSDWKTHSGKILLSYQKLINLPFSA